MSRFADVDTLSDVELAERAAAVIAVPRAEVAGGRASFVLHAPLELLARVHRRLGSKVEVKETALIVSWRGGEPAVFDFADIDGRFYAPHRKFDEKPILTPTRGNDLLFFLLDRLSIETRAKLACLQLIAGDISQQAGFIFQRAGDEEEIECDIVCRHQAGVERPALPGKRGGQADRGAIDRADLQDGRQVEPGC